MLIWNCPLALPEDIYLFIAPPKPTVTAAGGGKINQARWVVIVGHVANQR